MSLNLITCPSLTALLLEQTRQLSDKPFLWAKRSGRWQPLSWRQVTETVTLLAGGLTALGIAPGDRVALVSENRPEWAIADLAIMAAGAITVPAYTTNTPADHLHILTNSGARAVIVSGGALAERVMAAAWQAAKPPLVIAIEPPHLSQSPGLTIKSWDETIALGEGRQAEVTARIAATKRTDTACLIYTSGTGGAPKGVMLSHGAILCNCDGALGVLEGFTLKDEVFLSFLPLSHAYEHTAGLFLPLALGAEIYYAESLEHLAANMAEVRPTFMTAVPRLYETLRSRILKQVERQSGLKARLFEQALSLGCRRIERGLGPVAAIADRVLDRLVRDKIRARFGGRLKALVSGGAPLAYDLALFFTALGVRILQGYGLTESAPVVSVNLPGKTKLASVGPPMRGVSVKIAADGEILVAGELLMQGYWNDPEASARVLRDGWLYTGDIGEMDEDGYIRITDRKKDIIVNSGGDNVSPQRVESFLTLEPEIAQAMVFGDRRPHLVALLIPAADWAEAWAQRAGKPADLARLITEPDLRRAIAEAVDRVNRSLSPIEKVRRFILAAEPFSTENGMLTPTLKIRRHRIREQYGADLESLYEPQRPNP